MTRDVLHRVALKKPSSLGACTKLLVEHGFSPWSFWEDLSEPPQIIVQFHAPADADLNFLRPLILAPLKSR